MRLWLKEVKSFIFSYHFSNGLRTTISVVVPSVICLSMGQLITGITISTGALCAALADQPGTVIHKRNGAFITLLLLFVTALGTGLCAPYPFLMVPWIMGCCFVYSMLLVYGNRGGNIGVACLLVMIVILGEPPQDPMTTLLDTGLVVLGGLWHGLLALLLWQIRHPARYRPGSAGRLMAWAAGITVMADPALSERAAGAGRMYRGNGPLS